MKFTHLFWDWNGTLLDDAKASWLAVNDMLTARNLPLITFENYRDYIDIPIIRFYEKVMDVSNENMDNLSVEFNGLYSKHLGDVSFDVERLNILDKIADFGTKQYIFSSSSNKIIKPYLEKFGISEYFTAVLGADDCYVGSKVQRTVDYINSNHIDPSKILFVGDMLHDKEVADAVGAECVLLSVGHQSEESLKASCRSVLPSISALAEFLNNDYFTTEVHL